MAGRQAVGAKRKRRVKGKCPNPLFVKWLEEWRDEAKEKGVQSHYGYTKALNSLKKYPLPLYSGQEAKILDHIGEKLAKRLDKKLAEHRASSRDSDSEPGGSTTPPRVSATKVGRKRKERATTNPSPSRDHAASSSSSKGSTSTDTTAPPKSKRKSTVREYIPLYRSGPYAVLIALYNAEQKSTWRGYLTKAELISEAQPHSDTSFTHGEDGSYYTAWSSVSQIVGRGLVQRVRHPPRFSLTDAGVSMALRLLQGNVATTKHGSSRRSLSSSQSHGGSSGDKSPKPSSTGDRAPPPNRYVESPPSSPSSTLTDSYSIDDYDCEMSEPHNNTDNGDTFIKGSQSIDIYSPRSTYYPSTSRIHQSNTTAQSSNVISLCDSDSDSDIEIVPLAERIGLQVKKPPPADVVPTRKTCDIEQRRKVGESSSSSQTARKDSFGHSDKEALTPSQMAGVAALKRLERQKKAAVSLTEPLVFDLTGSEDPPSTGTQESTTHPPKSKSSSLSTKERQPSASSTEQASSKHTKSSLKDKSAHSTVTVDKRSVHVPVSSSRDKLPQASSSSTTSRPKLTSASMSSKMSGVSVAGLDSVLSSATGLTAGGSSSRATSVNEVDLSSPEFILKPGEFDVVLCVDNSESSASRNSRAQFRGILLSELGKNGVQFDVRKLNVGDFTWIAREKVQPLPGCLGLPSSREVVLEYIVERKRMDDLAGSIIDGRFNEQKFRLNQCGVSNPIYLVEEFADSAHLKLPERSLNQAVANTQVISGFFVKRTRDIRESVAYLTVMTRALQRRYADKTIKAYSRDTVIQLNKSGTNNVNSNTVCSLPFQQFNEASVKTKTLSVYEMFGRHLVQLPGFSVDKAAAVLERYPTVSHLREAFQKCCDNSERERLLSDVKAGPSKRRIGPQLSALVCSLYWKGE